MKARLLIVDDEEYIRRVVSLALGVAGYETVEAETGERALALFTDGSHWDAVLLDQKLPGMDGLETLTRIRDFDPVARVIMITAFASIELAVDAMKLGATDFIRKPMTPEILRGAVASALTKPLPAIAGKPDERLTTVGSIDTLTMNGFHVFTPPNFEQEIKDTPLERRFRVRGPDEREVEVTIEIDQKALDFVERMTHRRIDAADPYWTIHAQRTLTDYLWSEAQLPPGGRLKMHEVTRDDLETAARWNR